MLRMLMVGEVFTDQAIPKKLVVVASYMTFNMIGQNKDRSTYCLYTVGCHVLHNALVNEELLQAGFVTI